MAVYKVIQDVEAEDKLIGPLTLKQFIFACISAGSIFLAFTIASKTSILAFIPFLPFIIIPGVLAAPLGKDQPTDVWLAAKIRFLIKPRQRIWDQSGVNNLVTITAPKKIEHTYTKDLNQLDVKSRLRALADTIDSRGWATKSEDLNLFTSPILPVSDRLISTDNLPKLVPDYSVAASDDILDADNNATAQRMDEMVKESAASFRQAAIARMRQAAVESKPATEQRSLNVVGQDTNGPQITATQDLTMFESQVIVPHQAAEQVKNPEDTATSEQDELLLSEQLKASRAQVELVEQLSLPHHKMVEPLGQPIANEPAGPVDVPTNSVTPQVNPDIVKPANTDLSVTTIAGLANRKVQANNDEVVVNLH